MKHYLLVWLSSSLVTVLAAPVVAQDAEDDSSDAEVVEADADETASDADETADDAVSPDSADAVSSDPADAVSSDPADAGEADVAGNEPVEDDDGPAVGPGPAAEPAVEGRSSGLDELEAPEAAGEGAGGEGGADEADADGGELEQAIAPADEEAAPEEPPLPWRNSIFLFDNALNTSALGNSDRHHNPTFIQTFSLRPRYYVTDTAFLGVRQDVTLELTDPDCTALYSSCREKVRSPTLGNTRLTFFENAVFSAGSFSFAAGANIDLPTSFAARNREMYFATGPVIRGTYFIGDVLSGLIFQGIASYSYTFAGTATTRGSDVQEYQANIAREAQSDIAASAALGEAFALAGPSAQSHAGNATILGVLNLTPQLNLIMSFSWLWRLPPNNDFNPCVGDDVIISQPEGTCHEVVGELDEQFRLFTVFGFSVGYTFAPWINVALNYNNFTTEFEGSGIRSNPFWSHNSTVSLSATMTLDQLYLLITGEGADGNPLENMTAQGPSASGAL